MIIRVEDERRPIGDYVADQLGRIGFAVDRQYKTSSQARPIWNQSDPAEGLWHIYTGGWMTGAISRDDGTDFGFFYTPRGSSSPLWQAYTPSPTFDAVCEKLWVGDFASMAERADLFNQALPLALEDSARVWLVDGTYFTPRRAGTAVASDRASGVAGARMWPYVVRFQGQEGETMRIAQPGLLVEPWNPIAGSNWIYDGMPIRATQDDAFLTDPHTGLVWPQRAAEAAVVVKAGLPVSKTLDWVSLSFAPTIPVPPDAWVDWDAAQQRFITAGEKYPGGLTANVQSIVVYPLDLFTTVTWHDGSPLDLSDFVMRMIMQFDPAKPESPIYDPSQVARLDDFLTHFRGVRIVSAEPLMIETYDDQFQLDAELSAIAWWPSYLFGPGAWHSLAVGILAEAAGQLAFSSDKAEALNIDQTAYIGGASLGILASHMNQAAAVGYIPYAPTLGPYVTPQEAAARWANLQAWYAARGHFWLGTGPFYLESAAPNAGTLVLHHFATFPDPAGKWDSFAAPTPEIEINYSSGAPGSFLNVTGSGFPPNGTASVVVNGETLGQQPVNASGVVSFTLTTASADEGLYHLRVHVNPAAGVRFTLDSADPVRPREGEAPLIDVPPGLSLHTSYLPLIQRKR